MLLYVAARVVEEAGNVVVVDRIERKPAGAADAHQPRAPEQPKLMGDCRFGHADQTREIADTAFALHQRINQTNAGGIAEEPENVGHGLNGLSVYQPATNRLEYLRICGMRRLAGEVDMGHRLTWFGGSHQYMNI